MGKRAIQSTNNDRLDLREGFHEAPNRQAQADQ